MHDLTIQHVSKTRTIQPGPLGHFLSFRKLRCSKWGRLFSLQTRFLAGPAGRNAGCGQECPPHTNHEKALTGPKIIPGEDGGKLVPGIVSVSESGEIAVGSAARERLVHAKPPQAFQDLVNEVVDSSRD